MAFEKPFELQTPMFLQPGRTLQITCKDKIEIWSETAPSLIIGATSPISIFCEELLSFRPMTSLGPKFAAGWNKLSNELKYEIITHCVKSDNMIDQHWGTHCKLERAYGHCLDDYLAMGPEIGRMAWEAFDKVNTFQLRFPYNPPRPFRLQSPPMIFQNVRYLHLELPLQLRCWNTIKGISMRTGSLPPNLKHITIQAVYAPWLHRNPIYVPNEVVHIPCKGEVTVNNINLSTVGPRRIGHAYGLNMDQFRARILAVITFAE